MNGGGRGGNERDERGGCEGKVNGGGGEEMEFGNREMKGGGT